MQYSLLLLAVAASVVISGPLNAIAAKSRNDIDVESAHLTLGSSQTPSSYRALSYEENLDSSHGGTLPLDLNSPFGHQLVKRDPIAIPTKYCDKPDYTLCVTGWIPETWQDGVSNSWMPEDDKDCTSLTEETVPRGITFLEGWKSWIMCCEHYNEFWRNGRKCRRSVNLPQEYYKNAPTATQLWPANPQGGTESQPGGWEYELYPRNV